MKNKIVFILLTIGCFLQSCSRSSLAPSELIKWVENKENGLVQRQDLNNYFFEAKYKPLDYVIAIEGRSDDLSKSDFDRLKGELNGLQYIDMDIGPLTNEGNILSSGLESEEEYFERLDYFVTYANQDIFIVQGRDTLMPKLYHFERNYGLAPKNTLLLGFENGEQEKDINLYIDDQVLGVGRVKFLFKNEDIKSTPTLKLN